MMILVVIIFPMVVLFLLDMDQVELYWQDISFLFQSSH
jgi:hypothetical protein